MTGAAVEPTAREVESTAARTKRVVVVGTGTGVGKTFVSTALARALRESGVRVQALKPIESGAEDGVFHDAQALAEATGMSTTRPLYGYRGPVSPHLAAREEGGPIAVEEVRSWIEAHSEPTEWCIVETAGGILTPLGPGVTNFDLAIALEPALWVLVGPDSLGVLNSVSTTLTAMRALGRAPDACVLSSAAQPDASSGTNARELDGLGITPIAALFPRDIEGIAAAARQLGHTLQRLSISKRL